jgi:hypothetical protein
MNDVRALMLKSRSRGGARFILNLEGSDAARAGAPFTSSPYQDGSMESIGWLEGWHQEDKVTKHT